MPPELSPLPPDSLNFGGPAAASATKDDANSIFPSLAGTPDAPIEPNAADSSAFVSKADGSPKPKATSTKLQGSGRSNVGTILLAALGVALIGVLVYFASQFLGGASMISQLEAGECVENFFETNAEGRFVEIGVVSTVACEEPHAYEVFAVNDALFPDPVYPGVEESFAVSEAFCLEEYQTFIGGGGQNLATWDAWTFFPPEDSWSDERVVQCLVGDANEATLNEGTLRGAATAG